MRSERRVRDDVDEEVLVDFGGPHVDLVELDGGEEGDLDGFEPEHVGSESAGESHEDEADGRDDHSDGHQPIRPAVPTGVLVVAEPSVDECDGTEADEGQDL